MTYDCPTLQPDGRTVLILDQTLLPHRREFHRLTGLDDTCEAIRVMRVRGAPLIGATAAFGVALAMREDASDAGLKKALQALAATRPTAVNLHWALGRMAQALTTVPASDRAQVAWQEAEAIRLDDAATNAAIGQHGLALIREIAARRPGPVHVLTHCNAGWLATCGHGTALSPVYAAQAAGLDVHVWVSETRPRNQGLLTAWELAEAGVAHTLMADNAAGWLMAEKRVDLVIVGADRIAANGDTANKVGTSLKAWAAQAQGVPFYVAAPYSTVDFACPAGSAIPIEERSGDEVRIIAGLTNDTPAMVQLVPDTTPVCNPAFDVTPATCITGIITERGVAEPGRLRELLQEAS